MTTKKKTYSESEELKKAQAALQAQLAQKPGSYQSQWQDQLSGLLDQVLNRPGFSYDLEADPLYRGYRDRYVSQGRLAMLDTLGQTQAMTGGYSNSYAQSAGQQAYDRYLQGLSDRIPELYQLALNRYQQEGSALQDRLNLLQQQENTDYGRYQDSLQQWADQRDYLAGQYQSQRDYDYDRYTADRDYAQRQEENDREQQRWQAEFDLALEQWQQKLAAAESSGGSKGGGSYAGNGGVDAATVRKAQQFVGATADGMWGPKSQAAAKAKGYGSLQAVIDAMGGSGGPTTDHDSAVEIVRMVENGASEYEISARIAKLVALGQMSQLRADSLRKLYVSPKYYY